VFPFGHMMNECADSQQLQRHREQLGDSLNIDNVQAGSFSVTGPYALLFLICTFHEMRLQDIIITCCLSNGLSSPPSVCSVLPSSFTFLPKGL
jgi:hypothetical protein